MKIIGLLTGLFFIASISAFTKNNVVKNVQQKQDSVVAKGAVLKKISDQFSFTEGASVDKHGNVFFTDQPNDKIWKYDVKGKLSVFLDKTGRSNGLYFSRSGNLLACADEKDELWSISPKGKVTVLLKDYKGHRLNGPNDLWEDKKGGIYFTDPYYQRPYWDRKTPDIDEKVFYLTKGKNQPVPVAEDLLQPNGIVGTPDGKYLYVADIKDNKTYRYIINKDGSLQDKILLIQQGSDGMTLDEKGNIYLTGSGGVTVYNKEGKKLLLIAVPAKWTANVCFGGKNRKTLFITASESVYTIAMNVKGVE
jgi:gluconolactonase